MKGKSNKNKRTALYHRLSSQQEEMDNKLNIIKKERKMKILAVEKERKIRAACELREMKEEERQRQLFIRSIQVNKFI